MKYYKTSEIAKIIGVHPNTVRLYEEWGFLPSIPRQANGYRIFSEFHLDQMQLARIALNSTFLGGEIRQTALSVIRVSARGDFKKAMRLAQHHLNLIQTEQVQADEAAEILEHWAQGSNFIQPNLELKTSQVATHLGITIDTLRNWERNGLIEVPRNPQNDYRVFGSEEIDRLRVIRSLRLARYSIMSILRMLKNFNQGQRNDLREILDTPDNEEDIIFATDRWLSTLAELNQKAHDLINQLEMMIEKREQNPSYADAKTT